MINQIKKTFETIKMNRIETYLQVLRNSVEKVNNRQYKFCRILIFMHTFARSLVFLFLSFQRGGGVQ